jgi:hypothetical protein
MKKIPPKASHAIDYLIQAVQELVQIGDGEGGCDGSGSVGHGSGNGGGSSNCSCCGNFGG